MPPKGVPLRPLPPHGDRRRYTSRVDPCRCGACSEANTVYMAEYRERRRNNGRRPLSTKSDARNVGGISGRTRAKKEWE